VEAGEGWRYGVGVEQIPLWRQQQKMTYQSTMDKISFLKPDIAIAHATLQWPGFAMPSGEGVGDFKGIITMGRGEEGRTVADPCLAEHRDDHPSDARAPGPAHLTSARGGAGGTWTMATVSVRYIVDDVDAAVAFYSRHLGFHVELHSGPGFAMLSRGDLRLLLNSASGPGGAAQPMPDGRKPEPGGWNRIQLEVDDLAREVERLRNAGARFRNDIVAGFGGKQILLDDPAGNPIELFEPMQK
jgi:catechol 2,3-dioxygenase-like lactoylglutathione lyase family enzyme